MEEAYKEYSQIVDDWRTTFPMPKVPAARMNHDSKKFVDDYNKKIGDWKVKFLQPWINQNEAFHKKTKAEILEKYSLDDLYSLKSPYYEVDEVELVS